MARYFDIYDLLNEKSAEAIYHEASQKLSTTDYSCQSLLKKVNAEVVCTTEDPTDTLEYHKQLDKSDFSVKVSTAFRPDKAILISAEGYNDYIDSLAKAADMDITTYSDLCTALD